MRGPVKTLWDNTRRHSVKPNTTTRRTEIERKPEIPIVPRQEMATAVTGREFIPDDGSEESVGLEVSDPRVGWIYLLRKDDLRQEMSKFNLDTAGTVAVLRDRFKNFIRDGRVSPCPERRLPLPDPVPLLCPNPPPVYRHLEPLQTYRWKISFNGETDAMTFLERLEEIQVRENISTNRLLPVLPDLFTDKALLWCRNNRSRWTAWEDFLKDFRDFYLPTDYRINLEAEISQRLHRRNERGQDYVIAVQTLVRRHGEMKPDRELYWLYRNLLPEYKMYIRRHDFSNVTELTASIREYEELWSDNRRGHSEPPRELAPQPRPREPNPSRPPFSLTTPRTVPNMTTQTTRNPIRRPYQNRTSPARTNNVNERPNHPTTSRPSNPDRTPLHPSNRQCWRCGQTGHFRDQCRNTAVIFCSRCKRQGVMSRDCNCQASEN